MPCIPFTDEWAGERVVGFMCGEGLEACRYCGQEAEALCDYPVAPSQTCDQRLCAKCRVRVSDLKDIDFCPTHAAIVGLRERQVLEEAPDDGE